MTSNAILQDNFCTKVSESLEIGEIDDILKMALKRRKTCNNGYNSISSRSHLIIQLINRNKRNIIKFVYLAGIEPLPDNSNKTMHIGASNIRKQITMFGTLVNKICFSTAYIIGKALCERLENAQINCIVKKENLIKEKSNDSFE